MEKILLSFWVVSWADSKSRAYATEENRTNCLLIMVGTGCKVVCRLCFNLFTELSNSHCATKEECSESLASNITKYNHWTEQVIKTIRGVGGHNSKRILIIAPPGYTAKGLAKIDENIYEKDEHLIYHLYASGPNKDVSPRTGQPFKKYWEGCGSEEERKISYWWTWISQKKYSCVNVLWSMVKNSWRTDVRNKAGEPIKRTSSFKYDQSIYVKIKSKKINSYNLFFYMMIHSYTLKGAKDCFIVQFLLLKQ